MVLQNGIAPENKSKKNKKQINRINMRNEIKMMSVRRSALRASKNGLRLAISCGVICLLTKTGSNQTWGNDGLE